MSRLSIIYESNASLPGPSPQMPALLVFTLGACCFPAKVTSSSLVETAEQTQPASAPPFVARPRRCLKELEEKGLQISAIGGAPYFTTFNSRTGMGGEQHSV